MKLLVFFYILCCSSVVLSAVSERSCRHVHEYFQTRNISIDPTQEKPGSTCGGSCCSERREAELRTRIRKDFTNIITHTTTSLQSLFTTTANTIYDHVTELTHQSQNKTHSLFIKLYKNMAIQAQPPLLKFYGEIREYININNSDIGSPPPIDIDKSTTDFFKSIFPLVYHNAIKLQNQDFSDDYKICLREAFKEIEPFRHIPFEAANQLAKSLENTRVLLQALNLGSEVLGATEQLLSEDSPSSSGEITCTEALLKMSYCPKCQGLSLEMKTCHGYCLNVMSGCLIHSLANLDMPWNSFVETVEKLVARERVSEGIDLENKISEGIMYALTNPAALEKKVKRHCGHARTVDLDLSIPSTATTTTMNISEPLRVTPAETQMLEFVASVSQHKGFYQMLPETSCRDENYIEQNHEADCWNGERVGKYMKTVIALNARDQRYNPEVTVAIRENAKITKFAHRLHHMGQVIWNQMSRNYLAPGEGSMQNDDLLHTVEGSGSGRYGSDDDDDPYDGEGSASGSGPIDTSRTAGGAINTQTSSPPTGTSTNIIPQLERIIIALILLITLAQIN